MKLFFSIIGFLLFSSFVTIFAQEENEILWEKDILTWDDFQGTVNQLPEGQIDDSSFVQGIQYLIKKGIIQI